MRRLRGEIDLPLKGDEDVTQGRIFLFHISSKEEDFSIEKGCCSDSVTI